MEAKHYTPTIDEFHVGFEFQVKQFSKWETATFLTDIGKRYCLVDYTEIIDYINSGNIRIKYLDEQDILECGWVKSGNSNFYGIYGGSTVIHYGFHVLGNNKYKIDLGDIPNVIFDGIIKNNSELKRIMKMLGITHQL